MYTVAGSLTATMLGDGGPATNAQLESTEGIWIDGNCNLYISDLGQSRIRKVNGTSGIITTIGGTGTNGFSGDNGIAINAQINGPYGLYTDANGNVYFADSYNQRIRRIDALTGIITTIAGGGSSLGDGGPATNAKIVTPHGVYKDGNDNLYIGEYGRIRKVTPDGIISTFAGTGVDGLSGDNGPATAALISGGAAGMAFDGVESFYFADRGNARIRKINTTTGIISTIAGSILGDSGDNGPATNAQLGNPISIALDVSNNLIIADNGNNVIRTVNLASGIMTKSAGVGSGMGSSAEAVPALSSLFHPEFIYLDLFGNLYFSTYSSVIRKITNYSAGLSACGSRCGTVSVPNVSKADEADLWPNPCTSGMLTIACNQFQNTQYTIFNALGQSLMVGSLMGKETGISLGELPSGLYFVQLKNAKETIVRKLIIQTP